MLPSFITDVSRVLYDIDRDELIIGCYTTERPWDEPSLWGQVGTTILVYDKVKEKLLSKINYSAISIKEKSVKFVLLCDIILHT